MKQLGIIIFSMFIITSFLYSKKTFATEKILLTKDNMVLLKDSIDNKTISNTIMRIMTIKSKRVYLYIFSPGGSVLSGNRLINYLKTTDKDVYCIADFAASMAFSIMQHCKKRFVTTNSIMMQHEASLSLAHNSRTKLISFARMLLKVINRLEIDTAKQMGISIKKYKYEISKDWWMYGIDAIKEKAADNIANITCSNELIKATYNETISNMFSSLTVTWSKCPLLQYPIIVNGDKSAYNDKQQDILFKKLNKRDVWTPEFIKQLNAI